MHDRVAAGPPVRAGRRAHGGRDRPADVRAVLADQARAAAALRGHASTISAAADVRLIGHVVHHYDGPAYTGLAAGELGEYGLLTRSETLVFTGPRDRAWHTAVWRRATSAAPRRCRPARRPASAPTWATGTSRPVPAYEAGWYADTVRHGHDVQLSTAAEPLPGRGLVLGVQDPLRRETRVTPDAYWLLPEVVRDAAGLRTTARYDYRTGQPGQLLDPQGHTTTYRYHPARPARLGVRHRPRRHGGTPERPETGYSYDLSAYVERGPAGVRAHDAPGVARQRRPVRRDGRVP